MGNTQQRSSQPKKVAAAAAATPASAGSSELKHLTRTYPKLAESIADLEIVTQTSREFLQQVKAKAATLDQALAGNTNTDKKVRGVFLRLAKSVEASTKNINRVAKDFVRACDKEQPSVKEEVQDLLKKNLPGSSEDEPQAKQERKSPAEPVVRVSSTHVVPAVNHLKLPKFEPGLSPIASPISSPRPGTSKEPDARPTISTQSVEKKADDSEEDEESLFEKSTVEICEKSTVEFNDLPPPEVSRQGSEQESSTDSDTDSGSEVDDLKDLDYSDTPETGDRPRVKSSKKKKKKKGKKRHSEKTDAERASSKRKRSESKKKLSNKSDPKGDEDNCNTSDEEKTAVESASSKQEDSKSKTKSLYKSHPHDNNSDKSDEEKTDAESAASKKEASKSKAKSSDHQSGKDDNSDTSDKEKTAAESASSKKENSIS